MVYAPKTELGVAEALSVLKIGSFPPVASPDDVIDTTVGALVLGSAASLLADVGVVAFSACGFSNLAAIDFTLFRRPLNTGSGTVGETERSCFGVGVIGVLFGFVGLLNPCLIVDGVFGVAFVATPPKLNALNLSTDDRARRPGVISWLAAFTRE